GLYLIWLFLAACVALWQWTAKEPGQIRVLATPLGVACVSLAALFLTEFETRYYSDFRDDAPVAALMRRLRDLHPAESACIGGSSYFEPTVTYYRLRYRLTWLEQMKRTVQPVAGCRFYILLQSDRQFVEELGLRQLWTDRVSGTILAEVSP